jgi:hypothetical protein
MTRWHEPTIRDAVLGEFAISIGYLLLVAIATSQPDSRLGLLVAGWISLSAPIVRYLFAIVPMSNELSGAEAAAGLALYHHILAVNMLTACGCFLVSRRHWRAWNARIEDALSTPARRPDLVRYRASIGYHQMVLGLLAIFFVMLFGEYQLPTMAGYLFTAGWTYLRAPLLTALAFSFACHAAAFRRSLIR